MSTSQNETLRDIARIVSDHHDGVRGRALERIAEKAGHVMSPTTFDRIYSGKYTSKPHDKTLEALAFLADISIERVYVAAGKPYEHEKFSDQLPPDIDQLTEDQRNSLITVARAFLKANREIEGLHNQLEEQHHSDTQESDEDRDELQGRRESRDSSPEQKTGLAAYERGLGEGNGSDDVPEGS